MASIADHVLAVSGLTIYLVVGGLVFAEDALFVGFVLPGETAAILGGVAAHDGRASLAAMIAVVVIAAIVGDSVGYEIGKHAGPRMLTTKPLRRHAHRLDDARDLLARRGGWAVFLGRFTAFFRAVMPALAGLSHMPYGRFLPYNALGGIVWGTGVVLIGYWAGHAYQRIAQNFGRASAAVVLLLVLAGLLAWHLRKRRQEREEEAEDGPDSPESERS